MESESQPKKLVQSVRHSNKSVTAFGDDAPKLPGTNQTPQQKKRNYMPEIGLGGMRQGGLGAGPANVYSNCFREVSRS